MKLLIANIAFIGQNHLNGRGGKALLRAHPPYSQLVQFPADGPYPGTLSVAHEDILDDTRILIGDELSILYIIAQHLVSARRVDTCFHPMAICGFDVLADRPALILRNGAHQGKNQIAGWLIRADMLLLKEYRHVP